MRPTYRSLNKQLTLMGCDRQMMIAAMFVGVGLLIALSSVTVGLVTFFCFAGLGRAKAKDPATLRLIFNPGGARNQYDAAIVRPFPVLFFHDTDQTV